MEERRTRIVIFTAGPLQPDEKVFIDRLRGHERIDLVAIVVDHWRARWQRLKFLRRRWGLPQLVLSVSCKLLQVGAEKLSNILWRPWHDKFVPPKHEATYGDIEASGTQVLHVDDINSATTAATIRGLTPDLGVIVGGRILKHRIISIPRLGTLNIHKHDATKYRGSPQIGYPERLNGEPTLTVTIHFATTKVDQGDVVGMCRIPIERLDDDRSLKIKADVHGMNAYFDAIDAVVRGRTEPVRQDPSSGTTFVTTPYFTRWQFWRPFRRSLSRASVRPGESRWRGGLRFLCQRIRFAGCLTLLPT